MRIGDRLYEIFFTQNTVFFPPSADDTSAYADRMGRGSRRKAEFFAL